MDMPQSLEQAAHEVENRVSSQLEKATTSITHLNKQVTTYIRANPGRCLIGAVVAGYAIGRIARRK